MKTESFVFGYELDGHGQGLPITEPEKSAGDYWLHLDYSHGDIVSVLNFLHVNGNAQDSLLRIDTRPRTIVTDEYIVLLLRGVNSNPGADPEDMVSLRLYIDKKRLVSLRQRQLFSAQDMKRDLESGKGAKNIAELVLGLIEKMADRVESFVVDLDDKMERLEDAIQQQSVNSRGEITALRRQAVTVKRFISPQRDALEALHRQGNLWFDVNALFQLREQNDRFTRYVEDLELLRERTQLLQEELMNQLAQQQNNRMYLLAIITTIFLPISFLTGLFGMNVAGLPGTENTNAFLIVGGLMLSISFITVLLLKRNRWF